MGMLYGAKIETMMPKLHSQHFEGMELIRPLYLVKEADIQGLERFQRSSFHPVRLPFHRELCDLRRRPRLQA